MEKFFAELFKKRHALKWQKVEKEVVTRSSSFVFLFKFKGVRIPSPTVDELRTADGVCADWKKK